MSKLVIFEFLKLNSRQETTNTLADHESKICASSSLQKIKFSTLLFNGFFVTPLVVLFWYVLFIGFINIPRYLAQSWSSCVSAPVLARTSALNLR